jgi:hypothetical protein
VSEILKEQPDAAQLDDPRERWADIPGLRLPDEWPPKYQDVTPIRLSGTPLSDEIIRVRR